MFSWYAEQSFQTDNGTLPRDAVTTPAASLMSSLNLLLLIGWLLAFPSLSNLRFQQSRLIVFWCIVFISIWNILFTRCAGSIESINVGLNAGFGTILAVNFMLLHDPRCFKRLVLQPRGPKSTQNDDDRNLGSLVTWEPAPKLLWRRLFWVLDLITSFRAVHWSWESSLSPSHSPLLSKAYLASRHKSTLYRNVCRFVTAYIVIDTVKCLMIVDPYFNGFPTETAPPYLAPYITSSTALYTYRTLLAAAGVFIAVEVEYALAVLVQVNILGPKLIGLNASPAAFCKHWGCSCPIGAAEFQPSRHPTSKRRKKECQLESREAKEGNSPCCCIPTQ